MGWLALLVLAALVAVGLWRFGGFSRSALELLGAALLAGVAGYAWQGSPGLAGRPTPPPEDVTHPDSAFSRARAQFMERFSGDAAVLDAADAMHRQGWNRYAIGLIKSALQKRPTSPDLWVGLGNALVIHAGGTMSPAAQLAFERAAKLNPQHPGPPFFLGLAYAQAGQLDQAEATWRGLLDRSPPDAPYRADLEQKLAALQMARAAR